MITVKNLTRQPYLVDDDGHLLGGGETGQADDNSRHVLQAIAAGLFLKIEESETVVSPKVNPKQTSNVRASDSTANEES